MSEGKLKEEIRKWNYPKSCAIGDAESLIDEAKKEMDSFLHEYVTSAKKLDESWVLDQYDKWTTKWLGETPYEKWFGESP